MSLPRILAIMGSGETAPTMRVPHRQIFDRIGDDVDAVMLDTPFGFQENAPILAEKSTEYFRETVGRPVEAAGLFRADSDDVAGVERAVAKIRAAQWIFAGPGSPTFALRQWQATPIPAALADKLENGGAVVFSSAAALTLGVVTVPVYEVYKVGVDPFWIDGLNLLAPLGINAAVIPHYDNTEGGNHDTRFCYLGERRLAMLEPELPEGAFVLGIDEHTGVIMDLDADTAEIVGKGAVTLRRSGESVRLETGETISLDVLRNGGQNLPGTSGEAPTPEADDTKVGSETMPSPGAALSLAGEAKSLEAEFNVAIDAGDADAAVGAILKLETSIVEWSRDTLQSDEADQARASLRSMISRLGTAATGGLRDEREVLGPVVEAALNARSVARTEKAFAVSDALRDGLTAAGIEVRDTADGVEWVVVDPT